MGHLWHFYSAASAGFAGIPQATFDMVQASPCHVHTLVGDLVWEGYWGDQHNVVQGSQYIPTTMHNILKYILEQKHQELSAMAAHKETALASFKTAEAAQKRRRENGEPY
jgi:hypothetical protein